MKWTSEMRSTLTRLNAQGLNDTQIAEHLGLDRNVVASYRGKVMNLPANRKDMSGYCEECQKQFRSLDRHNFRAHTGAYCPRVPPPHRLRSVPSIPRLSPRGEKRNFSASGCMAALSDLFDQRRKAA